MSFVHPGPWPRRAAGHPRPPKGSKVGKRPLRNTKKTIGKTTFCDMGIRHAGNLIKPVENEDFGAPFSKMAIKICKKALPREGFRNAFSERRKTL